MADLDAGVELIVGCLRDPRFGPVLMVGLGGVFAEVLGDTAVALARSRARARGRCSRPCAAHPCWTVPGSRTGRRRRPRGPRGPGLRRRGGPPELAELEVNPVLATPDGALALDARAVPVAPGQDSTSRR
jgi:hypothetical protein